MKKEYSISVIIPVYNEIKLVKNSLKEIHNFLSKNFLDYEMIVIESGSTDGTYKASDLMPSCLSNLKVIHEGARKGFGSALRLGYKNASKDLFWLVTVDLPFPLGSILKALPLLSNSDCVLSYRSSDRRSLKRQIQSFLYSRLINILLGIKARNVNSAFKVIKRNVIKKIELTSDGWFIDAELLYFINKLNVSCAEIPVPLIEDKFHKSSVTFLTPLSILKESFYFMLKRMQQIV